MAPPTFSEHKRQRPFVRTLLPPVEQPQIPCPATTPTRLALAVVRMDACAPSSPEQPTVSSSSDEDAHAAKTTARKGKGARQLHSKIPTTQQQSKTSLSDGNRPVPARPAGARPSNINSSKDHTMKTSSSKERIRQNSRDLRAEFNKTERARSKKTLFRRDSPSNWRMSPRDWRDEHDKQIRPSSRFPLFASIEEEHQRLARSTGLKTVFLKPFGDYAACDSAVYCRR